MGPDVFIFDEGYGFDIVTDFDLGVDLLDVERAGARGIVDLNIESYGDDRGAVVTYTDMGDQIVLLGVDHRLLNSDNFIFVEFVL